MADRHQVRLPGQILRLQQGHRIGTVRGRAPPRMTRQRHPLPGLLAPGPPLFNAQTSDLPHGHPGHLRFQILTPRRSTGMMLRS